MGETSYTSYVEETSYSEQSSPAEETSYTSYIIFGILILVVIGGGVVLRLVKARKNGGGAKRHYKPAALVKTEAEMGEVKDAAGNIHRGPIAMKLTFQFKDGSTKTFNVDNKVRGKCSANDWGHLMYEGDKLLKFECPSGAIGTKLYVSKNVAKTAPPPQDAPPNRFKKKK